MLDTGSLLFCLLGGLLALFVFSRGTKRRHRYPPGPKGLPIVGNLFDVPKDYGWLTYQEWGRKYGSDIVHLEVLGQHIFVLNSTKAVKELFDKRSQLYSDRQQTVMLTELSGWHRNFAFAPYGNTWRWYRRVFHEHFRPQAIHQYHPTMLKGSRGLLELLLDKPADFLRHIRHISGSTVANITHGIDLTLDDNERLETLEKAMETMMEVVDAGGYLVDFVPILKYLPAWFPGARFKREAAVWKPLVDAMYEEPFYEVKTTSQGKTKPCLASALLASSGTSDSVDQDIEEMAMCVAGTAYSGSDTTVFVMTMFVQTMVLYPDVQRRAQEEIDRVIGRDRLPEMADKDSLPYVNAIIKELLRWHPVTPMAAPHKCVADDEYNGYHIPAGSMVIGNGWALLHDEERYPDPDTFKPSRFLTTEGVWNPDVPDPIETFGFGRRICPGRHFALDAVFLSVSNVLAAFTMDKAVDDQGKVIEPTSEYTSRLFWFPKPYKASITPRFEGARELIRMSSLLVE